MENKNNNFYYSIKRAIDIVFAVCFIIVFSPIYILTALIIYLMDFHSPIYTQERVGKDRQLFKFYKFRSMVVNADEILFKDKKLYEQMRSGENKVKDDPRVTKFGKFIRKYSIDEMPQMLNVLEGSMSVIGPRALRPDECDLYEKQKPDNKKKIDLKVSVKPGITGYWQVSGRSDINFDQRIDMDCYYAEKKSILFDLKIIFLTPKAVLVGRGAY